MIRRILLFLVALLAASWWMRRGRRAKQTQPSRQPGEGTVSDPMVRDRVCNTFLPRSRALALGTGEQQYFFCSEACRDKHAAAQKGR